MATPSKTFTSIPDTSVDAESPLDTTLMTQIRDSLIHLEEWVGKNYTAAVDHDHDGVNSSFVGSVNLNVAASSNAQIGAADNEVTASSTSYVKVKEIILGQVTGSLRVSFDLKKSNSGTVYGRIYKNGVAIGTERSTGSTSYVNYSEDLSGFSAGDLVQLYVKKSGITPVYVQNFRIHADKDYGSHAIIN